MTNFERLTQSPEVLGEFLRSLPVLEGPWDEEFQRWYCSGCGKASCDDGSRCPDEDKRNNPGWWLTLEAKKEEQPGTDVICIDAAEIERTLTAEEEAEMEKTKQFFRYAIESGAEKGVITILPMDGSGRITLRGEADIQSFINHLMDSRRNA